MTIGDLLVVMNQGRIHQVGDPETCYRRPVDTFVASFLGSPAMNFADARADGADVVLEGGTRFEAASGVRGFLAERPGAALRVGIRPEDIHPAADRIAAPVSLAGAVAQREPLGHETLTHLDVGGIKLVARGAREFAPGTGGRTEVFIDGSRVHIFWKETGLRIDVAPESAAAGAV